MAQLPKPRHALAEDMAIMSKRIPAFLLSLNFGMYAGVCRTCSWLIYSGLGFQPMWPGSVRLVGQDKLAEIIKIQVDCNVGCAIAAAEF